MPPAPPSAPAPRLGDRLLEARLINRHQLELALREQKRTGRLIGAVLNDLGFLTEEGLAAFLAEDSQSERVDVSELEIPPETARLVPYDLCKESALIPC